MKNTNTDKIVVATTRGLNSARTDSVGDGVVVVIVVTAGVVDAVVTVIIPLSPSKRSPTT